MASVNLEQLPSEDEKNPKEQENGEAPESEPCLPSPSSAETHLRSRGRANWKTLQIHVAERSEAKRATTEKWHNLTKLSSTVGQGVAEFFGVADEPLDEREKRLKKWKERSVRVHCNSVFLSGLRTAADDVDGTPEANTYEMGLVDDVDGPQQFVRRTAQPVDPLSKPTFRGRRPLKRNAQKVARSQSVRRKDSVMRMAYDGLRELTMGTTDQPDSSTPLRSRSFTPAIKAQTSKVYGKEQNIMFETFFDVAQPTSALISSHSAKTPSFRIALGSIKETGSLDNISAIAKNPTPDYIIRQPELMPTTPIAGLDEVDTQLFSSMRRIGVDFTDILLERSERQIGMGFVGQLFDRKYRQSRIDELRPIIDDFDSHRPFFTYWVTFVQIVCFVFMVLVYGTAPIGFTETSTSVEMPNFAWEKDVYTEPDNMWIGPSQAHLIHLGAKFSPCMRADDNVMREIRNDRELEKNETACCILNDGSGCHQSPRSKCSPMIARWRKLNPNDPESRFGAVCGYDSRFFQGFFWMYRYCKHPESIYTQDDVTKWPVCEVSNQPSKNQTGVAHMTCDIRARPCCIGILGQCLITTPAHCKFLNGYFHVEAQLCSQVSCLSQICGMLPFLYKDSPNQFYRLWTSLFIHAGLIPLLITFIFQMVVMRDVEKLAGWLRVGLIYLLSGIAGNLSSAIFLPYHPEAGPTGSQFGILACLFVEVIQSWKIVSGPGFDLAKLSVILLALFFLGLLPWVDNYAHMTGFIFGFLLSFPLLPHIAYVNRRKRLLIVLVCLGVAAGLFVMLIVFFYVNPLTECRGCEFLNCIPFTKNFCNRMKVDLNRTKRY